MTDFHTHILPMMDDGSASVDESLKMLAMEKEQGIDTVYLTPHFYIDQNHVDDFLARRQASFELLKDVKTPALKLGAEVFYFEGMTTDENIEKIKDLRLEGTEYLLLEMPFTKWTRRMIDDIRKLQSQPDITVLMAHIERYLGLVDINTLFELKYNGVVFQMNAGYIEQGLFHRKAKKLLDSGLISIISSDAHNMEYRKPNMALIDKL